MAINNEICNIRDPLTLGYYGSVIFVSSESSLFGLASQYYNILKRILCSQFNINAKQQTNLLKNIDTNFDNNIYNTSVLDVSGSMSVPVLFNLDDNNPTDYIKNLFLLAVLRDISSQRTNKISNTVDIIAKYSSVSYSKFYLCLVNNFSLSIKLSSPILVSIDIFGKDKSNSRLPFYRTLNNLRRNQRIATWSDAAVNMCFNGRIINGCTIRNFSLLISNNLEKVYTLNGNITPVDIICSQSRNISGLIKLLGRNLDLSNYSYRNIINKVHGATSGNFNRCNANDSILLNIKCVCNNNIDVLLIGLPGILYLILLMLLSPDNLILSSIKYKSIPGLNFLLLGGVNCCGTVVDKNFIG